MTACPNELILFEKFISRYRLFDAPETMRIFNPELGIVIKGSLDILLIELRSLLHRRLFSENFLGCTLGVIQLVIWYVVFCKIFIVNIIFETINIGIY